MKNIRKKTQSFTIQLFRFVRVCWSMVEPRCMRMNDTGNTVGRMMYRKLYISSTADVHTARNIVSNTNTLRVFTKIITDNR
jgi:hypothetical protein